MYLMIIDIYLEGDTSIFQEGIQFLLKQRIHRLVSFSGLVIIAVLP